MVAVQDHERRARGERLHLVAPVVPGRQEAAARRRRRQRLGPWDAGGAEIRQCFTKRCIMAGVSSMSDKAVYKRANAM